MKKFLICLLSVFMMASLAACGSSGDAESVSSAGALSRKLANEADKKIEISEDIVLTEPIEIVGNKELVGSGTITVSAEGMEESYMISLADGAQLTIGGKTTIDLSGLAGGIHVKEGATLTMQDEAVVKGASAKTANALIEGTFNMNGGTITSGFTNILCAGKSTFTWNAGTVSSSADDAIIVEENAKITITSADAKLEGVAARGLYLYGVGVIENVTMTDSMDSMIKVGPNGKLTFKGGKISDAGLHGIDNAGELLVAGGTIFANYDSGVCNTGTFEMTGGTLMNNKNKGVLNKAGTAKIVSAAAVLSGNRFAIGNEEGAYFELAEAKLMQSTTTNIYAYGGEMYIHDIVLATSGSNNTRVVAANVRMENMEIKGINASGSRSMHGLLLEGGKVTAKNVIIGNTTGNAIRNKGGNFQGENITIKDVKNVGISNINQDVTGREGIINITNVTVENAKNNNVLIEGGTCTLTNATLDRCATNNIKITDGKLILKKSTVNGNVADAKENNHAIYMTGGTIEANNVKVQNAAGAMLRINGEEAVFNGKKVTFKNAGVAGINQSLGTVKIDGLTTSGIKKNNVTMSKGTVELTNATLGPVTNNSIRLTSEGKLVLTDVEIQGHVPGTKTDCHAIFPTSGTIIGKNLDIHDVAGVAVRVNGEKAKVTLTNVDIDGAGYMAYRLGAGDVTVTDTTTKNVKVSNVVTESEKCKLTMTNASLCPTESNNVRVNNGTTQFEEVDIQGHVEGVKETVHGFFVSKGTTTAKNITISDAKVAAIRVNNDANVVMDGVQIKDPGKVGIQNNAGTTVITGLKTSGVPSNNIQLYGEADVTVKDSSLGKNADNSVRVDDNAVLALEDVVIEGHTDKAASNAHGIYAVGESKVTATNLTVENVKGAAIRTVETPEVTLDEVEIKNAINYGFRLGGGTVKVTNLTTEGVVGNNFAIEAASCDVTVKEAVLCPTENNNVRISNGTTHFENVEIQGHVNATETVHSFFVSKGTTTAKNLTIKDTYKSAIRVSGGTVEAEDVIISGAGDCGINASAGTTKITGLTIDGAKNYGIYSAGGETTSENVTIVNTKNGVGGTAGEVVLTDVESFATSQNVLAEGVTLELSNAILNVTPTNNVKIDKKSVVKLNDVQILGTTKDHGLYIPSGTVTAKNLTIQDVKSSAVRMNNAAGKLTATDVTIKNIGAHAFNINGGILEITELKTEEVKDNTVYLYGSAKVTLTDAQLATDGSNKNAIYSTNANGELIGENVTITKAAIGIGGTAGKITLTNSSSAATVQNVLAEGIALTLNSSVLNVTPENNIKITAGSLALNDVQILGTTKNAAGSSTNALYATGGTITVDGLDIQNTTAAALRIAGGKVTGKDVTFTNLGGNGFGVNGGTVELTDVTVSGVTGNNVYAYGTGSVTLTDATLNESKTHNVKTEGTATIVLKDSSVKGTTDSGAHGVLVQAGTVELNNVTIDGAKGAGIRLNRETSLIKGSDITVKNCSQGMTVATTTQASELSNIKFEASTGTNVDIASGTWTLNNVTVAGSGAESYGMKISGSAKVTLNGADVTGTTYDIYNTTSTLKLAGAIKADVYNDVAATVTATASLAGSSMTIDWPLDKLPAGMVGIQFANADDAVASESGIALGAITATVYAPYIDGDQMLLVDKTHVSYTVEDYNDLKDKLKHMEENGITSATITVAGDIVIPSTVTIAAGTNVTIQDDGTARTILRGTTFNTKARGVLFDVSDNASLTFKSTGTDKSPKLIIDGNKDEVKADKNQNWAIANSKSGAIGINSYEGVKFINNSTGSYGGVFRMEGGTLYIDGGLFEDNDSTHSSAAAVCIKQGSRATITNATFRRNEGTHGGAIEIDNGAEATISNCKFESNKSTNGGSAYGGGAIYIWNGILELADCTFTDNSATNTGKDIYVANANATVNISGKMIVNIYNAVASKLNVDGALVDGSDVVVDWKSALPTNNEGIVFASDDVMNASQKYISLGGMMSPTYSLVYEDAKGMLVQAIKVDTLDGLNTALTTISESGKTGVIRLIGNVNVPSTISIPKDSNVIIEDNGEGEAETIRRTSKTDRMFTVGSGASLTFRSSGNVNNPKLIVDGDNITATATTPIIYAAQNANSTIQILEGVQFKNNTSTGAGAVIRLDANAATLYIDGASFENNTAINNAGGVMTLASGNTVEIKNTTFNSNKGTHAGAVEVKCDVTITNCKFESNQSTKNAIQHGGGAIYNWGKTITIDGCEFTGNIAAYDGGAIYNSGGTLNISGTKFESNEANVNDGNHGGGAIFNNGGTVNLSNPNKSDGAQFKGNKATNSWGGAIYINDGNFTSDGYTFEKNKAKYGGALLMWDSSKLATVSNTTFDGNEATNEGGALYGKQSITFTDCKFVNNKATSQGGALLFNGSGKTLTITGTDDEKAIFSGNEAVTGGAIYLNNGTLAGSGYTFDTAFSESVYIKSGKTNNYQE